MSAKRILDADMTTIGSWLSQGLRWWVSELEQLLPTRLRQRRVDGLARFAFADGGLTPLPNGKKVNREREPQPGERIAIVVQPGRCLARMIERPALSDRDLQRMVAFEGESLLPFPNGAIMIAARRLGPAADPARVRVEVAGLPADTARAIADSVAETKAVAVRVQLEDNGTVAPIDFAPAMRDANLIARPRSATPIVWAAVGCFVMLNIALFIWKDVQTVERLEQVVQEQQPAVTVAQTIIKRTEQDRALVARSLGKRRHHDALGGLAATSEALPEGAWLQRFVWDGATVKITGYKPPRTDVASGLRRSGTFTDVRALNDEIQAEVPAGEPFDIGARINRR